MLDSRNNPKIGPFLIITNIRFLRIEDLFDWQMAVKIHGFKGKERLGNLVLRPTKDSEPPNFAEQLGGPREGQITLKQWSLEKGLNLFV